MGYVVETSYSGSGIGSVGTALDEVSYTEHGKAEAIARFYELAPTGQELACGPAASPPTSRPDIPVPEDSDPNS